MVAITAIFYLIVFGVIIFIIQASIVRVCNHHEIKKEGGIRTKYNELFRYFYNLPNSVISFESSSYVVFDVKDKRRHLHISMNYSALEDFVVKCKVSYFDDTAFQNGKEYKWTHVGKIISEMETLKRISETINSLP
ncbi:MAG: hypothetical protein IKU02_05170 [Bacteroidaceae bacterium]|nr:hypothetical protein [Bacteroidaceae bacterium]